MGQGEAAGKRHAGVGEGPTRIPKIQKKNQKKKQQKEESGWRSCAVHENPLCETHHTVGRETLPHVARLFDTFVTVPAPAYSNDPIYAPTAWTTTRVAGAVERSEEA